MRRPKPVILTVLDGWGYSAETKGNAIALARKPNYDFERRERERLKALKNAEKAAAKKEAKERAKAEAAGAAPPDERDSSDKN